MMPALYQNDNMALGYQRYRPALHAPIVQMIKGDLSFSWPVRAALDLGCGSGLSLSPLGTMARYCIGVEPSFSMLRYARLTAPEALLMQGIAEELPFSAGCFDLVTAAGSLNYVDLGRALREIGRVLRPDGRLAIYDFSPGSSFREAGRLDDWFKEMVNRYPPAQDNWRQITPALLQQEAGSMIFLSFQPFAMELPYVRDSYTDYIMTETSVRQAIHRRESETSVRRWLMESLEEVFLGRQEWVVFHGYIAYLRK